MTSLDTALFLWINAPADAPVFMLDAARAITQQLPPLAVLATVLGLVSGPVWRRRAVAALSAMALAWLAVRGLREAWPTPRPFELGLGVQWLAHGASASFPSFHAAVASAWAVALGLQARRGGWAAWVPGLAVAVALAIAWSRVYLGLHFVSDVVAGMALGALCALAVTVLMRRWPPPVVDGLSPARVR